VWPERLSRLSLVGFAKNVTRSNGVPVEFPPSQDEMLRRPGVG
jgi:hypothetical protein